MLYLDYCATTPPYPEVIRTVAEVMEKHFGNPSSLHRCGVEAERLLSSAREVIAGAIGCKTSAVIFTSGGTESNNLALRGAAYRYRGRGKHIITSAIEHASVHETVRALEAEGFEVTILPVDTTGAVSAAAVKQAIRKDTILVSLMHVNNEVGRIQPVAEIGRMLADHPRILFHVDAVQSVGKLRVIPQELGVDLLSLSAHKLRGPKGAGVLYCREGIGLVPQLTGGGQERGARSGTENVPLIVGMAKAVRVTFEAREAQADKLYHLRDRLTTRLRGLAGLHLTGSAEAREMAPHLVHFTLPGLRAEVVVHALEQHGICISTRSACASGESSPSRVLLAMGFDAAEAKCGLRVSYSAEQTAADMDFFADKLQQVAEELRGNGGGI